MRRNKAVYAAEVYHDSETDAAVDSKALGYFPSLQWAVDAVNEARDDYWQTGGVTYGWSDLTFGLKYADGSDLSLLDGTPDDVNSSEGVAIFSVSTSFPWSKE